MRRSTHKIGGRRRHDDHLRVPRETDVVKGVSGAENLGVNRPPRHGLEGDWTDELAGAPGHYDVDLGARLRKQTRQPH